MIDMTLKQLNIKREYRPDDNIVKSFYIPLLRLAQTYDRAVGFFFFYNISRNSYWNSRDC